MAGIFHAHSGGLLALELLLVFLTVSGLRSTKSNGINHDLPHHKSNTSHAASNGASSSFLTYPTFPEVLPPRSRDRPLKNKFEVSNSCIDCHADLHVVIFYRSATTCEVKVRRLDKVSWDFDIEIRIESLNVQENNRSSELHVIGPSGSSFTTALLTTNITLAVIGDHELHSNQSIPRIIMQTYYTTNATNIYHWNAFMTFVELNPEYEVLLMLDKHCRIFITKHFNSEVLSAYDTLVPKAFKADLFRYCFLYIKGGCYFDNKMINRSPLRLAILESDQFLVCSDSLPYGIASKTLKDTKRFYNAVICSAPRDKRMLKTIKYVVEMIKGKSYGFSDLGISGPVAFYEATKHQSEEVNVRFSHELGRHPYISKSFPKGHAEVNNGGREYRDYFVNEKINNVVLLTKFFNGYYSSAYRRYGDLWKQGKVFYESSPLLWNNHRLHIEPGILPYYTVSIDSVDGRITVSLRTYWNTYGMAVLSEMFKSYIRKNIMLAGTGGLTDKIELKLVNSITSDEYYISMDVPTRDRPSTVYSLREHLSIYPTAG
jgi:Glycosyltransferase sugar-binding region containing DXD motif